jgi:hypothetical protein
MILMMIESWLPPHALIYSSVILIISNLILDYIEDLYIRTLFTISTWMFLYYLFLVHIENITVCQVFWIPNVERNLEPLAFLR